MEWFDMVIEDIRKERERQLEKWGEQDHDPAWWLALLVEEVGEVAQAALHSKFGGSEAGNTYIELVHVAAVAVQWLEQMAPSVCARLTPRSNPK